MRAGAPARLPAAERRQAIVQAALRVFASESYANATTAQIAREAGVSEPILYRHFQSKRELYFACLDAAWHKVRALWEEAIAEEEDPRLWIRAIARRAVALHQTKGRVLPPLLWMQAVGEDDAAIRRHLRRHLGEIHDFIAGVIRRAQEAGGIPPDRDADAEAWIFLGVGAIATISNRLGGVIDENGIAAIGEARARWLTPS